MNTLFEYAILTVRDNFPTNQLPLSCHVYRSGQKKEAPRGCFLLSLSVFPEQDYSELERSLTAANLKVCSILNKPDDLKTDEGFQQYHEAAVEILEILHDYLPKLLRNEFFFNNVFYK